MNRATKQDEVAAILDLLEEYKVTHLIYELSVLLTHREVAVCFLPSSRHLTNWFQGAYGIINDIYLKWDFSNRCPFPPGVKRSK
jgi:hypothetical protein